MNTDACYVQDINILHIKECLLLSCVASFEDWSWIFRTWSFTLCKNDLDNNDMSDSTSVSKSISLSSTINLSVCCANKFINKFLRSNFHHFIRFPLEETDSCQHSTLRYLMSNRLKQVSLFFDAAHSMSSEVVDFHVWFSPGFLMQ